MTGWLPKEKSPGDKHIDQEGRMDLKSGRTFKSKREYEFEVVEEAGNLIVTLQRPRFRAVYYKPTGRPQLVLRERTKTDNQEIIADAWKAANAKARELGWIV